jgi:threonyl-tRNA synthetase
MQVDLCHGPHLPNTGYLKASGVNAFNRAFWRADVNKEPLQVPLLHAPHAHAMQFQHASRGCKQRVETLTRGHVMHAAHFGTSCALA